MQVTEIVHEGLKRGYIIALDSAHIIGLRDSRLAEIARSVPISGYRRGEAPWAAVMQRFGASVLGEVLEQEVAAAVHQLVTDRDLRPAKVPTVEVDAFTEGSDVNIRVALEQLPEVPLPDLSGLRLERLRARPAERHLRQALANLALSHGTLEEVAPRPAMPGDILVCDLEGGLPVDLLTNGVGRGARVGNPGLAPTDWSFDVSTGLQQQIVAVGVENGLPFQDLAVRGTTGAGAFLRIFPSKPKGLMAIPSAVLTLCMRARVVAGELPQGSDVRLGFNARSENDFLSSLRRPASLGPQEMRTSFAMTDNPTLAYARPVLEIALKSGLDLDITLRIGPARVFVGTEEPEALLFGGGSMTDQAIKIGGGGPLADLSAQLEGLAPNETRVVEAMLAANHTANELANKRVRYVVTARALRRCRPLAQDDALARAVGLADMTALEAAVLRSLQREYDMRARLRLKVTLLEALVATVDFPVPECLAVAEFTQLWQRVQAERRAGQPNASDAPRDEAQLRAEYLAIAERRIRLRLLMAEIARANDLKVSEEETADAIRHELVRHPGHERQVFDFYRGNDQALEALRAPLLEEKVVDLLIARAEVHEREVTPEELDAAR